jgi:WD40 repeat protein
MEHGTSIIKTLEGHSDRVSAVSFCGNGKRAVSGSWDNNLILWNVESGEALRTLKGSTDKIEAVSMSSDGRFAVSGSWGKTVKLWNVATG